MSAHARLGPSAAEAWMVCAGYPNAVEGLFDPTSEYAAEGTAAHAIADDALALDLDAYDFIGSKLKIEEKGQGDHPDQSWTFEWTEQDAYDLQPGLDEIRNLGGEFFGEHRVDLSKVYGVPGQFGTLDRGVILPETIVIGDLKWGRGIPVSPVRNKQLMIYGLGFYHNIAKHRTDAKTMKFIIDQPRCPGGGGHWSCSIEELLEFEQEVRIAAAKTLDFDAPRTASEKGCHWCARRKQPPSEEGAVSGCKTYDDYVLDVLSTEFDEIDEAMENDEPVVLPGYSMLSARRRSFIVRHKGVIEKWLEALHAAVIQDGLKGEEIPGLKVVDGRRGNKKWVDEEKAQAWLEARLGKNSFTKKLKSPAQALTSLRGDDKKALNDSGLFKQGDPKPVLVDEADERPAKATADDLFDEVADLNL
ncbi:MAG: DUF2800 domain-containing protein [Planctomycetota bacterium]